jgi:hypothetical protein
MLRALALSRKASAVSREILALPSPKRLRHPLCQQFRDILFEPLLRLIDARVSAQCTIRDVAVEILSDPDYRSLLGEMRISQVALSAEIMTRRFHALRSPVMTLRPELSARLEDMGISERIPAGMLRSPRPCAFIEFAPAESRLGAPWRISAGGATDILEGAYISETGEVSIDDMPAEVIRSYGLEAGIPARVIELSFTGSPLTIEGGDSRPVFYDMCDYLSLFIQDEAEPIGDMLERHIEGRRKLSALRSGADPLGSAEGFGDAFVAHVRDNLMHLAKALLYLHSGHRECADDLEESHLADRLKGVGAKKRSKLERRLGRAYDRILVGPQRPYTPIAERLAGLDGGAKRPHYRRGYLGIRWYGRAGARHAELTWVRPTIVGLGQLDGVQVDVRDYDIR